MRSLGCVESSINIKGSYNKVKEIVEVINSTKLKKSEREFVQKSFIRKREQLWLAISKGKFPQEYESFNGKKYRGAPRRTAIRCDFLLANKIALGGKYYKDEISDLAQRDLLFFVMRYRLKHPQNYGKKFYCCPKCTEKLRDCLRAKVFRYIDNDEWFLAIEEPN